MRDLVIFGIRNFAEVAAYYFTDDSDYRVVAFTVDSAFMDRSTFEGKPVIPFEELERHYPPESAHLFVAVGISQVNSIRAEKFRLVRERGYTLASMCHSTSMVPRDLEVRPNTLIMERCILQPKVRIGTNTILWGATRIAFNCRIGDHCWITSAILGESVEMGDNCFVGINATVAPFLKIGPRSVIGTGAVALQNLPAGSVLKAASSRLAKFTSERLTQLK